MTGFQAFICLSILCIQKSTMIVAKAREKKGAVLYVKDCEGLHPMLWDVSRHQTKWQKWHKWHKWHMGLSENRVYSQL